MNNMLFQQQRYYEDWGHETTLFLFEEFTHFLPEADVFFDPYKKYKIINLGWSIESFYSISKKTILDLFSGFDVLIGTDLAPAYLYKAGLKLDIFCLHGNDLYEYPFFRLKKNKPSLWEINRVHFSLCQFEGIKLAKYMALDKAAELFEKPISIIRKKGERMAAIPYLYLTQFTEEYFNQSTLNDEIKKLRSKFSFLILHHCAHNWVSQKNTLVYKGNDRLITAFAKYFHSSPLQKKACLILLEYGPDVESSKAMIKELGIESNVYWLPKQQRKNLMCLVKNCDIGVGELGNQGWTVYSVVVEFLIMSKPVIHFRNSESYKDEFKNLYEMVDTNQPEVVSETFLQFEKEPEKYREIGRSAYRWYMENMHDISLNAFKTKINGINKENRKINFLESLSHSNKIEKLKLIYWKLVNVLTIKLKLQNVT